MAGYAGFSMSNNAVEAYNNGEKPLSKWTKQEIIDAISEAVNDGEIDLNVSIAKIRKVPAKNLKEALLYRSSWHHTSCHYNRTDFYSIDFRKIENLSDSDIDEMLEMKEEKREDPADEIWRCAFLEWSGTRKHPKATRIEEVGTVRGNWFFRANGTKKSTSSNGFEYIEKIK